MAVPAQWSGGLVAGGDRPRSYPGPVPWPPGQAPPAQVRRPSTDPADAQQQTTDGYDGWPRGRPSKHDHTKQQGSIHPRTQEHMEIQRHQHFDTHIDPFCSRHKATDNHILDWIGTAKDPKVRKHGIAMFGPARVRTRRQGYPLSRGALEEKGPQRGPWNRLGRQLEEVATAVGGGYCRLQIPLRLALGVRETAAGHRLGALLGGADPLLPMHPWVRRVGTSCAHASTNGPPRVPLHPPAHTSPHTPALPLSCRCRWQGRSSLGAGGGTGAAATRGGSGGPGLARAPAPGGQGGQEGGGPGAMVRRFGRWW